MGQPTFFSKSLQLFGDLWIPQQEPQELTTLSRRYPPHPAPPLQSDTSPAAPGCAQARNFRNGERNGIFPREASLEQG